MRIVIECNTEGCNEVLFRKSTGRTKQGKGFHCRKCLDAMKLNKLFPILI